MNKPHWVRRNGGDVLVLAEEPRVDLIVRIAGAYGDGEARAFALRKDEEGLWMERGCLLYTSDAADD